MDRSENMSWYSGGTLLNHLENLHIASDLDFSAPRFPVQYVIRPQSETHPDYRAYAGRVAGGIFKKGEEVTVLPSGFTTKITGIDVLEGERPEAFPLQSETLRLADEIDISGGDMIV